MRCDKRCIFIIIFLFLAAVFVINRLTKVSDKKTNVFVQGAFYIDSDDIYNVKDAETIEKILMNVDPDILIVKEPVTFFDNLIDEFTDKISPSEKDSVINHYFDTIEEINSKLGFKIILLDIWDLASMQTRKIFYKNNKENRDFELKVDLYKKLNKIINKKIEELNLNGNYFATNSNGFDELKEIEGEFFSSLFDEELGVGNYKLMNKKYVNKIEEIIKKNIQEKILIIYDSNNKYELINRISKNQKINIIRIKENTKKRK